MPQPETKTDPQAVFESCLNLCFARKKWLWMTLSFIAGIVLTDIEHILISAFNGSWWPRLVVIPLLIIFGIIVIVSNKRSKRKLDAAIQAASLLGFPLEKEQRTFTAKPLLKKNLLLLKIMTGASSTREVIAASVLLYGKIADVYQLGGCIMLITQEGVPYILQGLPQLTEKPSK